jgi:hypothetical protein
MLLGSGASDHWRDAPGRAAGRSTSGCVFTSVFVFTSVLTWVEIDAKVGQRILQSVRIVSGSIGQFDINH